MGPGKEEEKGCHSNDPCARPGAASGMVVLGGGLLLSCACVGWGVGVCICAPRFFHVSGWGPGGGPGAACSARAGRILFWLCGAVVLRCAALCCASKAAGTLGPAGHGVAWPMEVEVGICPLAWMGMEREGSLTDDEGPTDTERASPRQEGLR